MLKVSGYRIPTRGVSKTATKLKLHRNKVGDQIRSPNSNPPIAEQKVQRTKLPFDINSLNQKADALENYLVMDAIKYKVDHEKVLNTEIEIKVQTVSITELENTKEIDTAYKKKAYYVEQTELQVDECTAERVGDHVCQMELPIVNFQTDLNIKSHKNQDLVAASVHIADPLDIEQHKSTQYLPKSQNFIPDDLLPSLNTKRQIIDVHKSKVSGQTPVLPPRIRKPGRWKTSPYMTDFGSGSVNVARIHWVLIVLSFNDRCLYVYDSYRFACHNASVADMMRKLSKLIPAYLANSNFYKKRGIDFSFHPRYIGREEESFLDVVHVDDLPHQSAGSLDCGVYVAAYAEYISHEKGVLPGFFDVEALHTRYVALLWSHGTQKIEKNTVRDDKSSDRPMRTQFDCDNTKLIVIP
ncbi:hypothetical protein CQW23_14160 [Capsicum baccatum]|uniref:Ubiquitin-like protease family profile domain-containing protein n=1 Tax=Capsicum baccatum TaxID=33114 RepID=A0A2G2WIF3_CAPBA|nr:hypothetical protein CQW23_14160 [Capsicum baccatum]